jgi:hypothetical protein
VHPQKEYTLLHPHPPTNPSLDNLLLVINLGISVSDVPPPATSDKNNVVAEPSSDISHDAAAEFDVIRPMVVDDSPVTVVDNTLKKTVLDNTLKKSSSSKFLISLIWHSNEQGLF